MIRKDLSRNKTYCMCSGPRAGSSPGVNKFMMNRGGEIHTIIAHAGGYYRIDDIPDAEHDQKGNWDWVDEMFEPTGVTECFCESLL